MLFHSGSAQSDCQYMSYGSIYPLRIMSTMFWNRSPRVGNCSCLRSRRKAFISSPFFAAVFVEQAAFVNRSLILAASHAKIAIANIRGIDDAPEYGAQIANAIVQIPGGIRICRPRFRLHQRGTSSAAACRDSGLAVISASVDIAVSPVLRVGPSSSHGTSFAPEVKYEIGFIFSYG